MHQLPVDLAGHVAIVTGGNHGIGASTAQALAMAGARVVVTYFRISIPPDDGLPESYRKDRTASADRVMNAIRDDGGMAVAIEADLVDPATPGRLFDVAESEFGSVDILVNNASSWLADTFTADRQDRLGRNLARVTPSSFDQQFSVDARAVALLISEFAQRHIKRNANWGRIIGLTSGGPHGFPGEVSYGAAKAALENYTMSAASELAGYGVTANIVYPPITDTGWITDDVRRQFQDQPNPVKIVHPDKVARVIAYLVSDEARLITGNIIHLS